MIQVLPTFYGHTVLSFRHHSIFFPYGLVVDIFLSLVPLLFLTLRSCVKRRGSFSSFLTTAVNVLFVLYLPNTVYLALELKHLILTDGIADSLSADAFMGFFGISVLGLYLTAYTVLKATRKVKQTIFLCFTSACGATLGMYGLNTSDVFTQPLSTLFSTITVYTNLGWLLFSTVLFLTLLLVTGMANLIVSSGTKSKSLL